MVKSRGVETQHVCEFSCGVLSCLVDQVRNKHVLVGGFSPFPDIEVSVPLLQ